MDKFKPIRVLVNINLSNKVVNCFYLRDFSNLLYSVKISVIGLRLEIFWINFSPRESDDRTKLSEVDHTFF